MPTYEYRCSACHREFEYQQKMSDADLVHCEACGADKLERLISWTSVRSTGAARPVHYSAAGLQGADPVDRSRPQRFTGNEPATAAATPPGGDAAAGADAGSGTDSGSAGNSGS